MNKEIIEKFNTDDKKYLILDNGEIKLANQRTKEQAQALAKYMLVEENKNKIQSVFDELYASGSESCIPFQKDVKQLFEEADMKDTRINFLQNYTKQWMSKLPDDLKSKPITELFLPGTHDSGAYQIDWSRRPANRNKWWQKILFFALQLPFVTTFVKTIVEKWTVTQKKSIQEQLEAGVRLFDFRLAKDSEGRICLAHTFIVADFKESIQQVADFIKTNTKELIVINAKVEDGFELLDEDMKKVNDILELHLAQNILPSNFNLKETTLEKIAQTKQNVILFGKDIGRIDKSEEIWPNVQNAGDIEPKLISGLEPKKEKELVYGSFNTTPDIKTIIKGTLLGENLKKRGKKAQEKIPGFLKKMPQMQEGVMGGLILDAPKRNTVQSIVRYNFDKLEKKVINK